MAVIAYRPVSYYHVCEDVTTGGIFICSKGDYCPDTLRWEDRMKKCRVSKTCSSFIVYNVRQADWIRINKFIVKSILVGCEPIMVDDMGISIADGSFFVKDGRAAVPEPITYISRNSFSSSADTLTAVELPPSLQAVGTLAFSGCTELSEVVFSEGLKDLDITAFRGCTKLRELTLPRSIRSIDRDMLLRMQPDDIYKWCKFRVYKGTVGERYAKGCHLKYELIDAEN